MVDGDSDQALAAEPGFRSGPPGGKDAAVIVDEKGMKQVTDTGAIEKVIDEVMAANPDKVSEYRSGKDKLFGFFVGQVMKLSGGKANPAAVNDLLKKKLS